MCLHLVHESVVTGLSSLPKMRAWFVNTGMKTVATALQGSPLGSRRMLEFPWTTTTSESDNAGDTLRETRKLTTSYCSHLLALRLGRGSPDGIVE